MKRIIIAITVLMILAGSTPTVQAQQSEGSKTIAKFKYPEIKMTVPEVGKEVRREVLDNGIILYMMENHSLPLFNITAYIRCGEAFVPIEQMAIPEMTGQIMRSGGTANIDPDSLNILLESLGARLEVYIGHEQGTASLNLLSGDKDIGIMLLADVLRNPAFPEDKIDLAKQQHKTDIQRRNDSPESIVSREFRYIVYGDHPMGRILEWEYVKPVTRDDLIACHRKYFAPNNLMLGITGDFEQDEIIKLINRYFGDWERKDINLSEIPGVTDVPKPGVYRISKDINQTSIRIGHLGIDRDNPDRYAVAIMNYILGGGSFTSRMTGKVRSDEGLAYSVGSVYQIGHRDLGLFYAYCQTKSETTYKAMRLMLDEIERIREGKVDDEELESAKDSYINRYVFNFDSPAKIVRQLMSIEFNNRPPDLLKVYLDNIRKVTKDDILRVAKKYLKPENLTFTVVGNPDNFDKSLDSFGPVTDIELKEPIID